MTLQSRKVKQPAQFLSEVFIPVQPEGTGFHFCPGTQTTGIITPKCIWKKLCAVSDGRTLFFVLP